MPASTSVERYMTIEPLTAADFAEVSDLLRACFEWVGQRDGFTPARRSPS